MPIDRSQPDTRSDLSAHLDASGQPTDSELKYQRLVEGISGDYIIYTHTPEGVITYVSPSIQSVLGFSEEAVLGLNWRDLVGEQFIGRDLADRVLEEVEAGKDRFKFSVEISHADGSTRLIEIQQRPIFDAAGNYTSMEGIAKDITESTRDAEELQRLKKDLEHRVAERTNDLIRVNDALRKSEARYRTVVNCQTEFIVRWMPGAVLTFANEAYCRLIAKPHNELIGWCFLESFHPDEVNAFNASIEKLSRENPISDFENRVVLPDGSVRWTQWTNQMLFDEEGGFLEYQSVGRDVSALKEAADIIREKEAHLAHMSRLATMGELVAGIAHEIHQPLHAAKTFSEAARRNLELGTDEHLATAMDCTQEISNAISRTAKIIRRMREFTQSRAETFEDLDINEIVRGATELVAFETRKAQVRLEFDLQAAEPIIQGDRIQLEQICVNLIMNACEAMSEVPKSDRRLLLSSRSNDEQIEFAFCDSGCGVTDEALPKLFDTFYSTKERGLGMGLTLCKNLADAHGGRIFVKQNTDAGMTFVMELPRIMRTTTPEKKLDLSGNPLSANNQPSEQGI